MRLADVPERVTGPSQVLVEVHHVSLNHGDLDDARPGRVAAGGVLESDAAGVVVQAAADGTGGPAAGARLVPPSVDLANAAALPVAGVAGAAGATCRWRSGFDLDGRLGLR
jgi:NADPH2:quinone reductase